MKQVVATLITSQAPALPLWLEVLAPRGYPHSSDKQSFKQTVQAYCRQLAGATPPWFVMDSAAYSAENLAAWHEVKWVTRVPETIGEAKGIVQVVATAEMTDVGDGYRIFPLCSTDGGHPPTLVAGLYVKSGNHCRPLLHLLPVPLFVRSAG